MPIVEPDLGGAAADAGPAPQETTADAVAAWLDGRSDWPYPVYLCERRDGRRRDHGWFAPPVALADLVGERGPGGIVELFLPRRTQPVPADAAPPLRWTGIHGLEAWSGGRVARMAPSHMIAANLTWPRALERCRAALGGPVDRVLRVAGWSLCMPLGRGGTTRPWHRAGPPVDAVDPETVAHALGGWLVRNSAADGRLTYKYWPSRGRESPADNAVRQFMGTLALGRYARWSGRADAMAAWTRNLDRQLAACYREEPDGTGMIVLGGSAKLGAAAIAGLALLEAPATPPRAAALEGLSRGIERLWRPDGSFRTFHFPRERNDNQNFYPGEACLFWAALHGARRDGAVLARLLRSLDHYRDWHRAHRNPAFVPWHSQAHAALHAATGMTERSAFVFEMNDWLLPMQQWETAPADDMRGRFYDPGRPDYGPPHAASTGAYMEGLAAAIGLARALGEEDRAGRYVQAFRRALRNIRQLAFMDEEDFFCISRRARVAGGVRTEVYDNTIRVDNVQHPLMAIIAALPFLDYRQHMETDSKPGSR